MASWIDRDDLIDILNEKGIAFRADINDTILSMPEGDVAIITRCKDCKWKEAIIEMGIEYPKQTSVLCGVHDIVMRVDDFCSYGEREDED